MSIITSEKGSKGGQGTLASVRDDQIQRTPDESQIGQGTLDENTSQQAPPSDTEKSARFELAGVAESNFSADAGPLLQIGMTRNSIMQELFEDPEFRKVFQNWVEERDKQVPKWFKEAQAREHRKAKGQRCKQLQGCVTWSKAKENQMNRKVEGIVRKLCVQYACDRGIDLPCNDDCRVAPAVGAVVADTSLLECLPRCMTVPREKVWNRGTIQSDPLGALLAANPIKPECRDEFAFMASTIGIREACEVKNFHNAVHVKLCDYLFRLTALTLKINGYDGSRALEPERDAALLDRLRKQRRVTESTHCDGDTPAVLIRSAIEHLPPARKFATITLNPGESLPEGASEIFAAGKRLARVAYFAKNSFSPIIIHRELSSWGQEIIRRSRVAPRKVRQILRQTFEFMVEELGDIPTQSAVLQHERQASSGRESNRLRKQCWDVPHPVPRSREIGSARLSMFLEDVAHLDSPMHVVWAAFAFLFCPLRDLSTLDLTEHKQGFWIATKQIREPQKAGDSNLHRVRTSALTLPVVTRLALLLEPLLKSADLSSEIEAAREWLGRKYIDMTESKLSIALATVGIYTYNYPWVIAHSGLYPLLPKLPAPRSYTHISSRLWRHLENYMRILDSDYATPAADEEFGTGSGITPRTECVREFNCIHRHLLEGAFPGNNADIEAIVYDFNGLVATTHCNYLLCAGLRNYPMLAPELSFLRMSHWELYQQKDICVATISDRLCAHLEKVHLRILEYVRYFEKTGFTVDDRFWIYAYGFARADQDSATGGKRVRFVHPTPAEVKGGILLCQRTDKYGGFHDNFMRHFAGSILREYNVPEMECRLFLGHFPYMLSPLGVFRLEGAAAWSIRNRLGDLLAKEAGLWC